MGTHPCGSRAVAQPPRARIGSELLRRGALVTGGRLDNDVRALDPGSVRALLELLGGDREVLAELVDAFVDEAPKHLADLRLGAAGDDVALAGRAAHTLKSNALTFGAAELASLCRRLEVAAAKGTDALAADRDLIDRLDVLWNQVLDELVELRDGGPP
jgi:HPt (histidine-containing phosphotransfer) domain-containing protein